MCMHCQEQEILKRYYVYDEEFVYEVGLCWTCNNRFRQELLKTHDNIALMLKYGAKKRRIGKRETLAPPAKVLHVDYVGYKR